MELDDVFAGRHRHAAQHAVGLDERRRSAVHTRPPGGVVHVAVDQQARPVQAHDGAYAIGLVRYDFGWAARPARQVDPERQTHTGGSQRIDAPVRQALECLVERGDKRLVDNPGPWEGTVAPHDLSVVSWRVLGSASRSR